MDGCYCFDFFHRTWRFAISTTETIARYCVTCFHSFDKTWRLTIKSETSAHFCFVWGFVLLFFSFNFFVSEFIKSSSHFSSVQFQIKLIPIGTVKAYSGFVQVRENWKSL